MTLPSVLPPGKPLSMSGSGSIYTTSHQTTVPKPPELGSRNYTKQKDVLCYRTCTQHDVGDLHFTTRGKSKFSQGLGNSKCETALDGKYFEIAILEAIWNGAVTDAYLRSSYTDIYMASQELLARREWPVVLPARSLPDAAGSTTTSCCADDLNAKDLVQKYLQQHSENVPSCRRNLFGYRAKLHVAPSVVPFCRGWQHSEVAVGLLRQFCRPDLRYNSRLPPPTRCL